MTDARRAARVLEGLFTAFYALLSLVLALTALALVGSALYSVWQATGDGARLGTALLNALGFLVLAMAVFDVAKYLCEEEVVGDRELRSPVEARQTLTKFMVIICIAVCLEAVVYLARVQTSQSVADLLYPTLLLVSGVFVMVGLGVYQRLSGATEAKDESRRRAIPAR